MLVPALLADENLNAQATGRLAESSPDGEWRGAENPPTLAVVPTAEVDSPALVLMKVEDIPSGNWFQYAQCSDSRSLFFAGPGERPERRAKREVKAKRICATCPVQLICRDIGREQREHGVWGGETETERAALGYLPRRASRRLLEERTD